jgi:FixJ family two-component response regulator
MLLNLRGLEVEVYVSLEGFLRGYRARSDGCLLVDQHLDGSLGLDFIRSAKWRALGLPTILMTGAGSTELHLETMHAGAAGYLEKPFDEASLIATIYDAVRPMHNRPETNRDDLGDPAPASQVILTLRRRSLSQRIAQIKMSTRQVVQSLRQRVNRLREATRSHQSGVLEISLLDTTPMTGATFIDAPRDGDLRALYQYWDTVRGGRAMPQRADIDPTEIPNLLPCVIIYDVLPGDDGYRIRLAGGEVTEFVGRNLAGQLAGSFMMPRAAEMMKRILDTVAKDRVPKFRAGKAHWHPEKTYRDFEACFLPLSSDGETANMILGGIKTRL